MSGDAKIPQKSLACQGVLRLSFILCPKSQKYLWMNWRRRSIKTVAGGQESLQSSTALSSTVEEVWTRPSETSRMTRSHRIRAAGAGNTGRGFPEAKRHHEEHDWEHRTSNREGPSPGRGELWFRLKGGTPRRGKGIFIFKSFSFQLHRTCTGEERGRSH